MHSYPRTYKYCGKAAPYYIPSCSTVFDVIASQRDRGISARVQLSSKEMSGQGILAKNMTHHAFITSTSEPDSSAYA